MRERLQGLGETNGQTRYVVCRGWLWVFPPDRWLSLLDDIADGKGFRLGDYGVRLSSRLHDLAHLTPATARRLLDRGE